MQLAIHCASFFGQGASRNLAQATAYLIAYSPSETEAAEWVASECCLIVRVAPLIPFQLARLGMYPFALNSVSKSGPLSRERRWTIGRRLDRSRLG